MENPFQTINDQLSQLNRQIGHLTSLVVKLQGGKDEHEKPMGIDEAAAFLQMKKGALYKKVRSVPHRKINKRLLFYRSELLKYIEEDAVHCRTQS